MNYILFDDESRTGLLPFTYTRPVAEIRVGILTIKEKWEHYLNSKVSFFTEDYLAEKFPLRIEDDNVLINGAVLPDDDLLKKINLLEPDQKIATENYLIAWRINASKLKTLKSLHNIDIKEQPQTLRQAQGNASNLISPEARQTSNIKLTNTWDIFTMNARAITEDFLMITAGQKSQPVSRTNHVFVRENIFIEEGAKVECCVLNASEGYIYIGKNAEVMEGVTVRGPFSLGEGAILKMGARVYGGSTIGPHCRVGGEVYNTVMMGFSNKAHDGYIGNSVIGEWCNLGAGTNTSNLKNNYSQIKIWSLHDESLINTGLQFCGLMMGDHSKCSINTMFNTGTVVGVSANIFGTGFHPKVIHSFSWGGSEGFNTYRLHEAMEVAQRVCERRKVVFDEKEQNIMNIFLSRQ